MTAWADMLSKIGQKNSRLYDFVYKSAPAQFPAGDNEAENGSRRGSPGILLQELERERSRIARELHAGAGQPLAGIKMNLEMLDACSEGLPPAGRETLARLQTLAEQALEQVRAVSHRLYPPDWQLLSVEEAIRGLVAATGLAERIQVHLDIADFPAQPSHAVKIAIYRCAQECISNILRHSEATELGIALSCGAGTVQLLVKDNGRGLTSAGAPSAGMGLAALREHAAALGGSCKLSSAHSGLTVTVEFPMDAD
jgi:signal transduction histidine kinase